MNEQITAVAEEMMETAKKAEVPTEIKEMALEGLNKSRETYVKLAALAKDSSKNYEGLVGKMQNSARVIGDKMIDNAEKNTEAAFENAKAVLRCKDVTEATKLQAEFAQAQIAVVNNQISELFNLSQEVADEMVKAGTKVANEAADQFKTVV